MIISSIILQCEKFPYWHNIVEKNIVGGVSCLSKNINRSSLKHKNFVNFFILIVYLVVLLENTSSVKKKKKNVYKRKTSICQNSKNTFKK